MSDNKTQKLLKKYFKEVRKLKINFSAALPCYLKIQRFQNKFENLRAKCDSKIVSVVLFVPLTLHILSNASGERW